MNRGSKFATMVMVSSAVALSPVQGLADDPDDTTMGLAFLYACSEGEEGADDFLAWGLEECQVEVGPPETKACDVIGGGSLPCHDAVPKAGNNRPDRPPCSEVNLKGTVGTDLALPLGWSVDAEVKGNLKIFAQLRDSTICALASKLGAVGPAATYVSYTGSMLIGAHFDVEVSGTLVGDLLTITLGEKCSWTQWEFVEKTAGANHCNTSMGGDF